MKERISVPGTETDALYERLNKEALSGGYNLNPDTEFTKALVESLIINEKRYGYWNCPCRLSSGKKESDIDIICPCDYRDADLNEYGACYCGLYVSADIARGEKKAEAIPERRPLPAERVKHQKKAVEAYASLSLPVWRCRVCGYLCAREAPPEKCPVCKAGKERFERFI